MGDVLQQNIGHPEAVDLDIKKGRTGWDGQKNLPRKRNRLSTN